MLKQKRGFLYILPGLLGLGIFFIVPFVASFRYIFYTGIATPEFAGLGNFIELTTNEAYRLALSLSAFCLELCLAVLCLRALWRGGQSFANLFRQELCLKYPREIVRDNLEKLLIAVIAAVVLVVSFILLVRELVAFTPFMPPDAVPPVHIFDISHYLDVLRAPAVQTDYALLCRSTLFSLYMQSICAAVLSLCLLVLLWHRHPKEGFHAKASV